VGVYPGVVGWGGTSVVGTLGRGRAGVYSLAGVPWLVYPWLV